jgi:PAS domain S-box-containing protein
MPNLEYTDWPELTEEEFIHAVQIEQAKQEWESAADSMLQLICLLDTNGMVVRVNRTAELWGLGRVEDARGKSLHELLHRGCNLNDCPLRGNWRAMHSELLHGRRVKREMDDPILRRSIEIYIHPTRFWPGADAAATRGFAVAIIDDVTEDKRRSEALVAAVEERTHAQRVTQNALRDSEEKYRLLVETINEGLIVVDRDGVIRFANARLQELFGHKVADMIGHRAIEFVAPDAREEWLQRNSAMRRAESSPYELVMLGSNRRRYNVRVSPRAMTGPDGSFQGAVAVLMDVTERVRAEEALRRSENELRELSGQLLTVQEMERKRIAADLHDGLGQSLSALKFYVEGVKDLVTRGSQTESGEALEQIVLKIKNAVEEVRRTTMDLRPATLDDLGVIATYSWFCREYQQVFQKIKVKQSIAIREADIAVPLKTTLFRILQEALNNIAKHAKADWVQVGLSHAEGRIQLEISDNGQGFDLAEVEKRALGKNGLGLTSMRDRALLSGGTYEIESIRGRGTTIRATWPAM